MCLSHLIYTKRPCLIHTCHATPCPCYAPTMPFFSRPRQSTSVERRPVGYMPAFGFFRLSRGVSGRYLSDAYQSQMQVASVKPNTVYHGRVKEWLQHTTKKTICYTVGLAVRIFAATMRTFTKDMALTEQRRGAAWHVWINGTAWQGNGMLRVWIGLKKTKWNWKMKEEAADRTLCRTGCGRGYGPVLRQTAEWVNCGRRKKYENGALLRWCKWKCKVYSAESIS